MMKSLEVETCINDTFREFLLRMPEWVKSGSALGAKGKFILGDKE